MWDEALGGRELAWRLFLRDVSVRYRQSVLGVLWVLVLPLFALAVFLVLGRARVLNVPPTDVPYPVFLLFGLALWQLFAQGLAGCTNALVAGGSMVVKINFPKETLVVAALGQALVDFLVRLALVAAVAAAYGVAPRATALLAPLAVVPLVLLTLGLGLALSLLNVVFRDVAPAVTMITSLLMFLTPVAYPAPGGGALGRLMALNPLTPIIDAARQLAFAGTLADPRAFAVAAAASAAVFLVSWRVFHLAEYKMAEVA